MSFTESLEEIVRRNETGLLSAHDSWGRCPLGDVATVLNGFAFSSKLFTERQGVPLLRIRDILHDSTEACYGGEYDHVYLVRPAELVVGMDGDFNCALWGGPVAVLNQRVCKITPDERFYDHRFLSYALPGYLSSINDATSSVTVKHLSSRTVEETPLPLPPLAEQHRIVAEIEKHFTRLDAAVAALKRARANLKRHRAAVLKAACEGRLVPTEAALARTEGRHYEPARVLLERILAERYAKWANPKYQEPASPKTDELAELPEGWAWATVEQLVARSEYGTSVKCSPAGAGVPVLRIPNIVAGRVELGDLKSSTQPIAIDPESFLQEGDVLVCRTNGSISIIGKSAVVTSPFDRPHYFASYLLRFRFVDTRNLPRWFHLYLGARAGRHFIEDKAASSAGQHNISLRLMHSMFIPLPPLAEQQRIVTEVESRLSVMDDLDRLIYRSLKRAERLRQSILKLAFEGRLVPQDPNDESASVLLDRIRAERAAAGAAAGGKRRSGLARQRVMKAAAQMRLEEARQR